MDNNIIYVLETEGEMIGLFDKKMEAIIWAYEKMYQISQSEKNLNESLGGVEVIILQCQKK